MKKTIFALVISTLVFLMSSCVTHGIGKAFVELPKEPIIASETIFYMRTENLDYSVANAVSLSLTEHGLQNEIIHTAEDIPDLSTKIGSGTCFSILPSIIVTNAHVLEYEEQYLSVNDELFQIVTVMEDPENDLAIAEVLNYEFPYSFRIYTEENYTLGSDVYAIGYPTTDILSEDVRITKGIINAKSGVGGDPKVLQISAQIQPGNSGGPVLLADDFSKAAGIVTSKVSDVFAFQQKGTFMQNVNFAIKSNYFETIFPGINDYLLSQEVKTPKTLEEASQATGLIYTTETPFSPYEDRLLITLSLERTQHDTLTQYGTFTEYTIAVDLTLSDVDEQELYHSWFIQSYSSPTGNWAEVANMAMDEFLSELMEQGYLIGAEIPKET
jgi:S1-C subfamily serine protease